MLNDNEHGINCLKQLNGKIHFICGNHEGNVRPGLYEEIGLVNEGYATVLKYKKWTFYLSHYPSITNNLDDAEKPLRNRVINLCGHSHTKDRFTEVRKGFLSYHCELDAHDNKPILLDNIIEDLKKENNLCQKIK